MLGPQDYMNSSWFNRTEDSDGVFVPMSCCVPVTLQSEEIVTSEGVLTTEHGEYDV